MTGSDKLRSGRPLRIFVPSAATLLTDSSGHGEGLIAFRLLTALASRGHDVVACARQVDLARNPGFRVIETGHASRRESVEPLFYARRVGGIFRSLGGSARFDVAHWLFPQGSFEVLFPPAASLPFVVGPQLVPWPQGGTRSARPGDLVRLATTPAFRLLHRRTLNAASILLVSVPEATAVTPSRLRQRTRLVPFGVDTREFGVAPLPAKPVVAFVGRLELAKGIRVLVDAFARVAAAIPEAQLVVVGAGPERGWVERRSRDADLAGRISLRGLVAHPEIPQVLAASSLLCLPSSGEPFGIVLLEAMACGRAVVAVDNGGPRYLVDGRSGGRLVPPGDVARLGDALVELLGNGAILAEMGRYNRRRAEREFDLTRMVERLEDAYIQAMAGSTAR